MSFGNRFPLWITKSGYLIEIFWVVRPNCKKKLKIKYDIFHLNNNCLLNDSVGGQKTFLKMALGYYVCVLYIICTR